MALIFSYSWPGGGWKNGDTIGLLSEVLQKKKGKSYNSFFYFPWNTAHALQELDLSSCIRIGKIKDFRISLTFHFHPRLCWLPDNSLFNFFFWKFPLNSYCQTLSSHLLSLYVSYRSSDENNLLKNQENSFCVIY